MSIENEGFPKFFSESSPKVSKEVVHVTKEGVSVSNNEKKEMERVHDSVLIWWTAGILGHRHSLARRFEKYCKRSGVSVDLFDLDVLEKLLNEKETTLPDVIVLSEFGQSDEQRKLDYDGRLLGNLIYEDVFRFITQIREKQGVHPLIITHVIDDRDADEWIRHGADIALPLFFKDENLIELIDNVPDLLNAVEGEYVQKVSAQKKGFYENSYNKKRLENRAQLTADTKKELEIFLSGVKEKFFTETSAEQLHLLDAGCGYGRMTTEFAEQGYVVTGIDLNATLLERAQKDIETKGRNATLIQGDLREMSQYVQSESHNIINFGWHVFCDILGKKNKESVLKESFTVLRHGGVITLDIPDRERLDSKEDGFYFNRPDEESVFIGYIPIRDEMKALLENAGFVNVHISEWKTSQGYPKLTFTAQKEVDPQPHF